MRSRFSENRIQRRIWVLPRKGEPTNRSRVQVLERKRTSKRNLVVIGFPFALGSACFRALESHVGVCDDIARRYAEWGCWARVSRLLLLLPFSACLLAA